MKTIKRIITLTVPPIILKSVVFLRNKIYLMDQKKLKTASWYNDMFENSDEYKKHYTESIYYFVWTVLNDRLQVTKANRIVDLGCGPGQVAQLLRDNGIKGYHGIDFSEAAIDMARKRCPDFNFSVADISKSNILKQEDYDCVITMEFLEHIEGDIDVLQQIKPDTPVFLTVPSFDDPSHVRFFKSEREVAERYGPLFKTFKIDSLRYNSDGSSFFFLLQGTKA